MNAELLWADLVQRDISLRLDGEQLVVDAPRGVLTEELRRTLSEHKPGLVELIRHRAPAPDGALPPQPTQPEHIAEMTLEEFSKAGLIVHVRSARLGCKVLFVSDNLSEAALSDVGLPIYRAGELRKLAVLRPQPHSLKTIHEVKTIFKGTIEEVSHE